MRGALILGVKTPQGIFTGLPAAKTLSGLTRTGFPQGDD